MATETEIQDSTVARLIGPSDDVLKAMGKRSNIFAAIDDALQAVISPKDPGGFSHGERAALACRISHLNANVTLASYFRSLVDDPQNVPICEPSFDGGADVRAKAVLSFTDLVAAHPKDTQASDVTGLQEAGLSDPDIVRLAELNAFMAFMVRVVDGLALMERST